MVRWLQCEVHARMPEPPGHPAQDFDMLSNNIAVRASASYTAGDGEQGPAAAAGAAAPGCSDGRDALLVLLAPSRSSLRHCCALPVPQPPWPRRS